MHKDAFGNFKDPGWFIFNLPAGTWYLNQGTISKADQFEPYELFPYPKAEHFFEVGDTKLICARNPNKATITPLENKIVLDEKFSKIEYLPALHFVIGHEFGHYRCLDESKCDLISANLMLGNGFNPSQVKLSFENLFINNNERLDFLNSHYATKNFIR